VDRADAIRTLKLNNANLGEQDDIALMYNVVASVHLYHRSNKFADWIVR